MLWSKVLSGKSVRTRRSRYQEARLTSRYPTIADRVQALSVENDPLDRHFLFEAIVRESFRLRHSDHRMRQLCEEIGMQHLREFHSIAPRLRQEIGYGKMPQVATFQCLGTVMTEWGAYNRAVDIYEMALSYGIDDDTDGGFRRKITALHRLMR